MQPLSERGIIYASQIQNPQLWAAHIQLYRAKPVIITQSFVEAIFKDSISESDKKRVASYLAKKEPVKLERLFDRILQGKMLDADAKLSRVAKELKQMKERVNAVEGRLNLFVQMTKLQTAYQIELNIPLRSIHTPPNPAPSNGPEYLAAERAMMQQREQQYKPLIEKHEKVVQQRLKLREEAKDLLAKIERDVTHGETTVNQPIHAIDTILALFVDVAKAYEASMKQATEFGAVSYGA